MCIDCCYVVRSLLERDDAHTSAGGHRCGSIFHHRNSRHHGGGGRAVSDGTTVNKLHYAVYESGTTNVLLTSAVDMGNPTVVSVTLAKGLTYDIAFWAQHEEAPYTFDATNNCIKIDWTKLAGNNEQRDAFIFVRKGLKVTGVMNETIELKRPFAQLNIGVSDYTEAKAAGFELATTKVSVESYDQINFFGGENYAKADGSGDYGMPAGTLTEVAFEAAAPLTGANEFFTAEGKSYKYVSMNYILPAMPEGNYDVDITFNTANDVKTIEVPTFTDVTFERNHRTNIYGSLLTNASNSNIEIEEGYEEGDHNVTRWDGTATVQPSTNDAGEYVIDSPEKLAYMLHNYPGTTGAATTLNIAADIDMGGYALDQHSEAGNQIFHKVVIKGNNHTISNYTATGAIQTTPTGQPYRNAGLFPVVEGLEVSNLTLANAVLGKANDTTTDIYGGALVGTTSGEVNITGVTVENVTVYGVNKVGGLIGQSAGTSVISDCQVINTQLHGQGSDGGSVGGFIGYVTTEFNHTISNCTVEGGKIVVTSGEDSDKRASSAFIGVAHVKSTGNTVAINGCSTSNVDVTESNTPSPVNDLVGALRDNGNDAVTVNGTDITPAAPVVKTPTGFQVPDAIFRNWLIDQGYVQIEDEAEFGPEYVLTTDAGLALKQISINGNDVSGIVTFTGIEAFVGLTKLEVKNHADCTDTTFDISKMTQLTSLVVNGNPSLRTLDLTYNTALTQIHCYKGSITELDITGLAATTVDVRAQHKDKAAVTVYKRDDQTISNEGSNNSEVTFTTK